MALTYLSFRFSPFMRSSVSHDNGSDGMIWDGRNAPIQASEGMLLDLWAVYSVVVFSSLTKA